ncbi:hypothetical protein C0J52_06777 [Blattella germanica]|nr:hypothetical protein C0J52_06777 [Blattella germanica]
MKHTPKDMRDSPAMPRVYRISCTCNKVHIVTTKRSVKARLNEHKGSIHKHSILNCLRCCFIIRS